MVKTIVKRIKAVAHSVLNFHIPPLWVVVVFLVVLIVWQTHEILQMKRQVRSHAKSVMLPEHTVYVADGSMEYHGVNTCSGLALELRKLRSQGNAASYSRIGLLEADEKYSPCPRCYYVEGYSDLYFEELRQQRWREEWDYDDQVRRSLERQGIIDRY